MNVFYNKMRRSFSSMSENTINNNVNNNVDPTPLVAVNNNVDPTPLVAKSIEKDIDTARTHLNNHVTTEEEILTLDKNCEYCQIYLKE